MASNDDQRQFKFAVKILSIARNDYQLRLIATILKTFFYSARSIRKTLYISFHIWTIFIAYNFGGKRPALLTALLPLISELYWLVFLSIKDTTFFIWYFLIMLTLIWVAQQLGKLKAIDITSSYW
jgi:hypothetical protein